MKYFKIEPNCCHNYWYDDTNYQIHYFHSNEIIQYLGCTDKYIVGIAPNKKAYQFEYKHIIFVTEAEYIAGRMLGTYAQI